MNRIGWMSTCVAQPVARLELKNVNKWKFANFLLLMPFKCDRNKRKRNKKKRREENQRQINNIAVQQIKNQVKQMKSESLLYNQFNEFSSELQKIKHIQSF